jgi:DNA-directed RNA polymerase specialized sigma24 family protein
MSNPISYLTDPEVTEGIVGVLRASGVRRQDVQDGVQNVYLKVLASFDKGAAVPEDVDAMRTLCVTVAMNLVIDDERKAATRKKYIVGRCDPEEYTPLEYGAQMRDPVDAGRQLEVLAHLFRERRMPEHGVDILEGVACRCTHQEIGEELEITPDLVEWRMRTMRKVFRARMAKLGMLPATLPLRVVVSEPGAIPTLRMAA